MLNEYFWLPSCILARTLPATYLMTNTWISSIKLSSYEKNVNHSIHILIKATARSIQLGLTRANYLPAAIVMVNTYALKKTLRSLATPYFILNLIASFLHPILRFTPGICSRVGDDCTLDFVGIACSKHISLLVELRLLIDYLIC